MVNIEETKEQIQNQFDSIMETEQELIKKLEDFRNIDKDWVPENDDEAKELMPLARSIDGGINFALRQLLCRYGNLLFI